MNRKIIIEAIEQAAATLGYEFHCDGERQMPVAVKSYPAMWLMPPQFAKIEGRRHGKITFSVELLAMEDGAKYSAAERRGALERLEVDVVQLFSSVSQHQRVVAVNNLSMDTNPKTHSTHGELVTKAKTEVVVFF